MDSLLTVKDLRLLEKIPEFFKEMALRRYTLSSISEYTQARWAADNVIFGSGGGLLVEGLSRDWSRWAIKPSYIEKAGVPENVQKIPASDMSKASKKGKLKLHRTSDKGYMTIESSKESPQGFNAYVDTMEVVLENGKFYPKFVTS